MKELMAMSKALDESADMRHKWKSLKVAWHSEYPFNSRKKLRLRRRILDEIRICIDSGYRDENEIAERVCQSLIGMVIIEVVLRAMITLIAKRLVIWWERRNVEAGSNN